MRTFLLVLFLCLVGCAPSEVARLFGIGTESFRTHGRLHTKEIARDYDYCFSQTMLVLGKKMGGNPERGRKDQYFVIFTHLERSFPQATSATELIVFFKEISADKTEIQVSSLNYSLSDYTAPRLFDWLEGKREGLFEKDIKDVIDTQLEKEEDEEKGLNLGDGLW